MTENIQETDYAIMYYGHRLRVHLAVAACGNCRALFRLSPSRTHLLGTYRSVGAALATLEADVRAYERSGGGGADTPMS